MVKNIPMSTSPVELMSRSGFKWISSVARERNVELHNILGVKMDPHSIHHEIENVHLKQCNKAK